MGIRLSKAEEKASRVFDDIHFDIALANVLLNVNQFFPIDERSTFFGLVSINLILTVLLDVVLLYILADNYRSVYPSVALLAYGMALTSIYTAILEFGYENGEGPLGLALFVLVLNCAACVHVDRGERAIAAMVSV